MIRNLFGALATLRYIARLAWLDELRRETARADEAEAQLMFVSDAGAMDAMRDGEALDLVTQERDAARKAAQHHEWAAAEAGALVIAHEGRIARLTEERDALAAQLREARELVELVLVHVAPAATPPSFYDAYGRIVSVTNEWITRARQAVG